MLVLKYKSVGSLTPLEKLMNSGLFKNQELGKMCYFIRSPSGSCYRQIESNEQYKKRIKSYCNLK